MTVKLSEELQRAVDAQQGMPVEVEHPVTHQIFILTEQPTHEKAMEDIRRNSAWWKNHHSTLQAQKVV